MVCDPARFNAAYEKFKAAALSIDDETTFTDTLLALASVTLEMLASGAALAGRQGAPEVDIEALVNVYIHHLQNLYKTAVVMETQHTNTIN